MTYDEAKEMLENVKDKLKQQNYIVDDRLLNKKEQLEELIKEYESNM